MVLRHRTERRVAIVESKAWKQKVGGSEINKFVGAFGVEKDGLTKRMRNDRILCFAFGV